MNWKTWLLYLVIIGTIATMGLVQTWANIHGYGKKEAPHDL